MSFSKPSKMEEKLITFEQFEEPGTHSINKNLSTN